MKSNFSFTNVLIAGALVLLALSFWQNKQPVPRSPRLSCSRLRQQPLGACLPARR